jgi:hypothetical protein
MIGEGMSDVHVKSGGRLARGTELRMIRPDGDPDRASVANLAKEIGVLLDPAVEEVPGDGGEAGRDRHDQDSDEQQPALGTPRTDGRPHTARQRSHSLRRDESELLSQFVAQRDSECGIRGDRLLGGF